MANTYLYEFTGKTIDNDGTFALGTVNWASTNDGGYYGYDATKGQQIGSGSKPAKEWTLTTSEIKGTITSIKLNTSGASSVVATLDVIVGGQAFGSQYTLTKTATDVEFKGSAVGGIILKWTNNSAKALYLKSIEVTFTPAAGTVEVPTFSLNGGTYYSAQTVALSAAEGDIYYSTDGTFKKYTEAIPVNVTTTIKAYAQVGDKKSSEVSQTYTIAEEFASLEDLAKVTPNNGPVTVSVKNLEITSIYVTSKGDRNGLYFTLADGKKIEMYDYDVPEEWVEGGTVTGKLYGIWKDYNGTWEIDGTNTSFDYATDLVYTAPTSAIELPTITPAAGTYTEAQAVTITAPEGCGIVYTLDGTTPVYGSGTLVESNTTTFTVSKTTTVKAIAFDLNDEDVCSNVVTVKITIEEKNDLTSMKLSEFTNTSFENWTNNKPDQWVSGSTASNATILQSDIAHTGSYAVKITNKSSNTRLASKELELMAGYYTMTAYVYGISERSQVRPGYVPVVVKDNKWTVGQYNYFENAESAPKEIWTEVKHTFKIEADIVANILIMNPKNTGDVVIDDFVIRVATEEEQKAYDAATAISSTKVNAATTGKFVENGKLVIVKGGKKYNAVGVDM